MRSRVWCACSCALQGSPQDAHRYPQTVMHGSLLQEGEDNDGEEREGRGSSSGSSSAEEGGEERGADFVEHAPGAWSAADLELLARGWTAFIVGIVRPAD